MKRLTIAAIAAALAQFAVAETWYWAPIASPATTNAGGAFLWNKNNWTNSAATRGFPQRGDTAVLGWGNATKTAYYVCGDDASYVLHEVRFEGNKVIPMNQGTLVLQGGGGGLKYMHGSNDTSNWMGLKAAGDGEVPIHVDKNVSFGLQMRMQKVGTGNPTIVKTGPGTFICFNQASANAYTIPLTLIRQGKYDAWYVQLPLLAVFRYELPVREPGHHALLSVGPAVSYGLFGTLHDKKITPRLPQGDWNYDVTLPVFDVLNHLDASMLFGIGYEYQDLSVMLQLDYGLLATSTSPDALNISQEAPQIKSVPIGSNFALLLTVGYQFPIR